MYSGIPREQEDKKTNFWKLNEICVIFKIKNCEFRKTWQSTLKPGNELNKFTGDKVKIKINCIVYIAANIKQNKTNNIDTS